MYNCVPSLLAIWLVKMGTKLSKGKILVLEVVGFQLPKCKVISPRRLFGGKTGIELVRAYLVPSLSDEHPKNQVEKVVHENPKAPIIKHQNNCTLALILNARIERVNIEPHLGFGCIVNFTKLQCRALD